jgi:hypothetical protein
VRGTTVFHDGQIVSEPSGKLVKPGRQTAKMPSGE